MTDTPSEAEQRIIWRSTWLTALQAFADTETQRLRWTDPNERNPVYSFVECMCTYFDDAFIVEEADYWRKRDRGHVSEEEIDAVIPFHRVAAAYRPPNDDDYDIDAILSDPSWQQLTRAAQEARDRLLPLLDDEHERVLLMQPRSWAEGDGIFQSADTGVTYILGKPRV